MPIIDAFGARWNLDVSGVEDHLATRLARLWHRATVSADGTPTPSPDPAPAFVVQRADDGRVAIDGFGRVADDDELPYAVSRALTMASIGRRTGECLMLHAAGLAGDDGGTVALVGSSGTGKTTASRLLGQALGYVTDETVAVEHDLAVRAYPKPLSLVVDPDAPADKREVSPDDLGLRRAPEHLRLSATVVLERRDDALVPALEPIGLVDAMVAVLPQTSALPSLDRPLDRLATALTTGDGPWRLVYRDIEHCTSLVDDLAHGRLTGQAPDAVTWTWFDGSGSEGGPTGVPTDIGPSTTLCRTAFRDAIASDGVVLVLRDRTPTALPGLAATAWLAADQPRTVAELVVAATVELGPHPDAETIVVETVRSLLHNGILRAA